MSDLPPLDQPQAWVVVRGSEQAGPYTLDLLITEVVAGRLADTTPVWWPPLPDWTTMSANPSIAAEIARRRGAAAPGWAPQSSQAGGYYGTPSTPEPAPGSPSVFGSPQSGTPASGAQTTGTPASGAQTTGTPASGAPGGEQSGGIQQSGGTQQSGSHGDAPYSSASQSFGRPETEEVSVAEIVDGDSAEQRDSAAQDDTDAPQDASAAADVLDGSQTVDRDRVIDGHHDSEDPEIDDAEIVETEAAAGVAGPDAGPQTSGPETSGPQTFDPKALVEAAFGTGTTAQGVPAGETLGSTTQGEETQDPQPAGEETKDPHGFAAPEAGAATQDSEAETAERSGLEGSVRSNFASLVSRSKVRAERLTAVSNVDEKFVAATTAAAQQCDFALEERLDVDRGHEMRFVEPSGNLLVVSLAAVSATHPDAIASSVLPVTVSYRTEETVPGATRSNETGEHGQVSVRPDDWTGQTTSTVSLFLGADDYVGSDLDVDGDSLQRDLRSVIETVKSALS